MGNWIIYHKGTDTILAIDEDVVAINVSNLNDEEFDNFFNEEETKELAEIHGKPLSDELFTEMLGE